MFFSCILITLVFIIFIEHLLLLYLTLGHCEAYKDYTLMSEALEITSQFCQPTEFIEVIQDYSQSSQFASLCSLLSGLPDLLD